MFQQCDDVLGNMEELLSGFHSELSKISAEITTLQSQSKVMGMKLQNRQKLEIILSQALECVVGPELIK